MTYYFEHWKDGKLLGLQGREANSVGEAVGKLSESLKGVFRFVGTNLKDADGKLLQNGK